MQRRNFLFAAAAGVGALLAWRAGGASDRAAIAKVIHKRLHYLRLEESGVQRFAADMSSRQVVSSLRLRVIDAAGEFYTRLSPSPGSRLDNAIRHGEERIVTQYLISSDFFTHGADKNRVVNYLGYYDPLVACNNPFARPAVAAATVS
jgi:hypothetical protein